MHRTTWIAACITAGCMIVAVGGCGPRGPERAVLTGKVTYRNEPIKEGIVSFRPIKGTPGPSWGADIINGQYSAHGKGGVPVGTHRVEITAWRQGRQPGSPSPGFDAGAGPREQYIPAKYNTQSQLEVTVEPGSGAITRDFILTD